MIKFFRKIRQKMLTENKFSKYLIYAIGEIILVVIGILIALSVNNCNNVRIDRNEEVEILKALQVDFRETKKRAEKTIESQKQYHDNTFMEWNQNWEFKANPSEVWNWFWLGTLLDP